MTVLAAFVQSGIPRELKGLTQVLRVDIRPMPPAFRPVAALLLRLAVYQVRRGGVIELE
jgi:hypothetical protein